MTYPADWFIPPCDPAERNRLLDLNARNGWRGRPGMMDWDQGWTFDPEHATAPLAKPRPAPLPPTRPCSAFPTVRLLLATVAGLAALAGWWTR